jgi:hypothetical protein
VENGDRPSLDAAVVAVDGRVPADRRILERDRFLLAGEQSASWPFVTRFQSIALSSSPSSSCDCVAFVLDKVPVTALV